MSAHIESATLKVAGSAPVLPYFYATTASSRHKASAQAFFSIYLLFTPALSLIRYATLASLSATPLLLACLHYLLDRFY